MTKKRKITQQKKVKYCTWKDLENDPEQIAIYKEIAEINTAFYRKAYERAKANQNSRG